MSRAVRRLARGSGLALFLALLLAGCEPEPPAPLAGGATPPPEPTPQPTAEATPQATPGEASAGGTSPAQAGPAPQRVLAAPTPRSLGELSLEAPGGERDLVLEEGQNADLVVRLRNGLGLEVLELVPLDRRLGGLHLEIAPAREGGDGVAWPAPEGEAPAPEHAYRGVRFGLEPGESRAARVLLFDPFAAGPRWLAPGSYRLRAVYVPERPVGVAFLGQERVAWGQPLASSPLALEVRRPQPERVELLAAARAYLEEEVESARLPAWIETLRELAQGPLGSEGEAVLLLRLRGRATRLLLGKARTDAHRAVALQWLERLVAEDLSPAARDRWRALLAARYLEADRREEARRVLEGVDTVEAEALREAAR